ncbi:ABC transporter permease [Quadrisphaera sp. GCM10027208]|uniref:ABC transporter permease n=1 Tax=Quadrisphaera sp. GCM10027208 TaxID=3273423 RepID=UPI00361CF74C
MIRVAVRSVRGHLVRFLLTALAVLLGVAFVAGTFVLTDTMDRTFTGILDQSSQGTDVVVRAEQPADAAGGGQVTGRLPLDLASDIEEVDGVRQAEPDLAGAAVLVGADGTAVRLGGAPTLGLAWSDGDPALELVSGSAPDVPGEIAVEEETLAASGLRLGDSSTLVVGGQVRPVTVVAEVRFSAVPGSTLVFLEPGSARALLAPDGVVASFSVRAEPGTDAVALRDRVAAVLPPGTEAVTGAQQREEDTESVREALGFVTTFLLVFAGISLVVGAFLIANTFSMLVAQRTRELALLRAVGAGARQVVTMVAVEALVVGAVGGVLGLGAGIGLAAGLQAVLGRFGLSLAGGLVVAPRTVVAAVGVGTVVTVLAALPPAVRASRIPPVAAMRDDVALPERSLRLRGLVGAALLVAGGGLLWRSLAGSGDGVTVAVASLLLFLGTATAAPLVARPVLRVLAVPFTATGGPVGRLARGNALRNPRRTATTASALMVGITLVTGITVLSASATASTRAIVEEAVTADLVLNSGFTGFPATLTEAVAAVDGVESVAVLSAVPLTVDGERTLAAGTDPGPLADSVRVRPVAGTLSALQEGRVVVSASFAEDRDVGVGDTVTAQVGTLGQQPLTVGAVIEDNQAVGVPVLLPRDLADRAVPPADRSELFGYVNTEPGRDVAEVAAAVTDVVAPYVVVSVQNREEFVSAQAEATEQLLLLIYVLLALSVVIAVLGIVNTLALSVIERTREIGLLRAVGMQRRQLAGMVTVESVLTALLGAVLGAVLGLVLGVSLQRSLADEGLEVLAVPWPTIGGVLVLGGAIGVLAAVLPAVRAVRLDVLRAIATE